MGAISATVQCPNPSSEFPTLRELSDTIADLSATITELSVDNDHSATNNEQSNTVTTPLIEASPSTHPCSMLTQWCGFKLVGDNIDKNFRKSFQRQDTKTISLHAFHMYAVKDRVDFSQCVDTKPVNAHIDADRLLIEKVDIDVLGSDVTVLLSR